MPADRIRVTAFTSCAAEGALGVLAQAGQAEHVGQLPSALALIWLAARLPIRLGQDDDNSYGLCIWGRPVQPLLTLSSAQALSPWAGAVLAIACNVPLAWLSWKGVEEHAVRLRRLVPAGAPRADAGPGRAPAPVPPRSP